MSTISLYASKTGFSQRYAQTLAEELGCRSVSYQERKALVLEEYDTIILAGGVYAGRMNGLQWLQKQLPALAGKRLAALAVGASPADNPELPGSMERLFGPIPEVRGFYAQGGLDYQHMGAVDRAMMAAMRSMLKKRPDMADRLRYIERSFDAVDRKNLAEIIAWAKKE